jgi:hypothetical protein
MPTIVDFSQVSISTIVVETNRSKNQSIRVPMDENYVRHLVLNSVRSHIARGKSIGETILACDSRSSWRKQVFPQYKGLRGVGREESELDWDMIHRVLRDIREALRENFPVKVVLVEGAEADDVIGVAARRWIKRGTLNIVSGDKDFQQLHRCPDDLDVVSGAGVRVTQWNPVSFGVGKETKREIVCDDPERFLACHVLRGDGGDGVPSVLSPDDFFMEKHRIVAAGLPSPRQSTISAKMEAEWCRYWHGDELDDEFFGRFETGEVWPGQKAKGMEARTIKARYLRNRTAIALTQTPESLQQEILRRLDEEPKGNIVKAMQWLGSHGMDSLLENVTDFA